MTPPSASPSSPSAKPPSAARRRILEAARREFADRGFAGASIRAITRPLGLRESAFYAHFPSKQAAYDELFHQAGPGVVAHLAAELDPTQPLAEQLSLLAHRVIAAWTTKDARASTSIVLRESFERRGKKREQLMSGVSAALDVLAARLANWQQRGEVRATLSPRDLAFAFVAPLITIRFLYYNNAATPAEQRQGAAVLHRHVATFVTLAHPDPH
jgi:AcrR family transcriptional regulator